MLNLSEMEAGVNIGTHVAVVHRAEEGYVLINAHPVYAEPCAIVGLVNEPAPGECANLKSTVLVPEPASCARTRKPFSRSDRLLQ